MVMQGLISGVPSGSLVMIDLFAEVYPQWKRFNGFFGAPWLWCMLHNFGGNIGEETGTILFDTAAAC